MMNTVEMRPKIVSLNVAVPEEPRDKKTNVDLSKLIARLDPLSSQIYEIRKLTEQSTQSLVKKLYLRDMLYCTLAPHFAGCGLYIVGSTLNGFGNSSSDMDLCLMISNKEVGFLTLLKRLLLNFKLF